MTDSIIHFPADLPISQYVAEISAVIEKSPVVIIAGETGSGKTTQLPKIALQLGFKKIGHTQPRRLAARAVSQRIADELKTPLGQVVGFQTRFNKALSQNTQVKVMTDGILLSEIQRDRDLKQYDLLIIDEAHERSLNIDFILGYLKQLLKYRKDLKVIITSATIDSTRFSAFFNDAPCFDVPGRTYPVTVRYEPLVNDITGKDHDRLSGIIHAVTEILPQIQGDILIFMYGERDIRDTTEALTKQQYKNIEILPVYARLNHQAQQHIFEHSQKRRIILATNVAETSLTVPNITCVIDPGDARVKRYAYRSKIELLNIEKISQASANQRKGRCGRVMPGICIRLYSLDDFNSRDEFTDPEILRTHLAHTLLQMLYYRLGNIETFPFIDPPETQAIKHGYHLLLELNAIDKAQKLTHIGRLMAQLPLDPRLARIIVASDKERCLAEIIPIIAFLSIQDPRDRPAEKQMQADEKHRTWQQEQSDFLTIYALWQAYQAKIVALSKRQLQKWCEEYFLSWMRMREWSDVVTQLQDTIELLHLKAQTTPAHEVSIHRAILTGFISQIACLSEKGIYEATRGLKVKLFPNSSCFKKTPKWIVAETLIELKQVYAGMVAKIEPEWVIALAGPLLKYQYSEPYWDKSAGMVVALQKTSLYGLVLKSNQRIHFGRIDPKKAREIFIMQALVTGELESNFPFWQHHIQVLKSIEALSNKLRRRDIIPSDEILYQFYDAHLPPTLCHVQGLNEWYRTATDTSKQALFLSEDSLLKKEWKTTAKQQFPDTLCWKDERLSVQYQFSPTENIDGVSVLLPLALLSQCDERAGDWLVPGLLLEKITTLLRGLPKSYRKAVVPVPEFAQAAFEMLMSEYVEKENNYPPAMNFFDTLARILWRMTSISIPVAIIKDIALPTHLMMHYAVVDENNKMLAQNKDLSLLRDEYTTLRQEWLNTQVQGDWLRSAVDQWNFGDWPEQISMQVQDHSVIRYPALLWKNKQVELTYMDSLQSAEYVSVKGIAQLLCNALQAEIKYAFKQYGTWNTLAIKYATLGQSDDLKHDLILSCMRDVFLQETLPRSEDIFKQCIAAHKAELQIHFQTKFKILQATLPKLFILKPRIEKLKNTSQHAIALDMEKQYQRLLSPGFLWETPFMWLKRFPIYMQALELRLEKLASLQENNQLCVNKFPIYWSHCEKNREKYQKELLPMPEAAVIYRWMLEEWRVSLFAQPLKTAISVSEQKILKQQALF